MNAVHTRKAKTKITKEMATAAITSYNKGVSVKEIAAEHKVTLDTVYKLLRRNNITLKSTSVGCTGHRLTEEEKDNIFQDYKAGMKIKDICEKYDISVRGLYLNIDKHTHSIRKSGKIPQDPIQHYLDLAKKHAINQHEYIYKDQYGNSVEGFDSQENMQIFAIKQLYEAVMQIPEEMAIEA